MSLPNRTESFINGSFAFTSVVVSSETDFSELNGLLSPDNIESRIIEPSIAANVEPYTVSQNPTVGEKVYRLDQGEETLTPNQDVLRQNVFASVKSKLVDASIDVSKIYRNRERFQSLKDIESNLPIVVSPFVDLPGLSFDDSELQSDLQKPVEFNDVYHSFEIHPPERNLSKPNFLTKSKNRVSVSSKTTTGSDKALTHSSANHQSASNQIAPPEAMESAPLNHSSPAQPNACQLDFTAVINPAWEVKDFRWSEITTKLIRDYRKAFSKLVHSLKLDDKQASAKIAVVNTQAGQGATTLASCLSTILSETSARTILIDLDFENPALESAANIKIESGWQKILDGTSVNELLIRSTANQLTLMPLKKIEHLVEFRDEIASQLQPLSEVLEKHHEFLVYDAGSYSQMMSLPCGASFWDAIVVVSDSKVKESTSDAVVAYEKLLQAGAKSVVIAENFRQ